MRDALKSFVEFSYRRISRFLALSVQKYFILRHSKGDKYGKKCEKVKKMEEIVNIRLELSGEEAKKFTALKDKRGLKNNSEVVRQLLKEAEERELEEG